jgi:hypothetical protein
MRFHPNLLEEARMLTAEWYPRDAGSINCGALVATIQL